jgi:N-acetylglutamate synthase-like GNAT family acetyltransferase
VKISEPHTPEEFGAYYLLRFELLRKPWNRPLGSEKDEHENESIHAMAINEKNKVIGVCRLQFNSDDEAQIRFMAVKENYREQNVGRKLIEYLEEKATKHSAKKVILHSRENAVLFYERCGYVVKEKSYLMWDEIQHYLMEKKLP